VLEQALADSGQLNPRSLLALTNVAAPEMSLPGVETAVLGSRELTALVAASRPLRLRVPTVLGIGAADDLVVAEVADQSTPDIAAARALAPVFVPTRAYAAAVEVLAQHHFVVLTGPPEMGKTAIARTVGLAALTDGWELHECVRPDELWARFRRERRQVFIADDAFGSTEYRPEAAERWALELDRVLRAMDEKHWLLWTSRPAPFKAGLRRIHREHGVERFPQPAQVQVDAADLDVAEKALILFRHSKSASLPSDAVELVKAEGWAIVSHPHFTPERIRRFVATRLLELSGKVGVEGEIEAAVAAEIREPTDAMAASFRALSDQHRALLVALLDTPPGPVAERELVAAFRRHSPSGLAQQPTDLVDRLTDHFLRLVDGKAVTWVHPSWRDLVIDQLSDDKGERETFLRRSALDGLLLALSTAGGAEGERLLPLMREDRDWDAIADRLAQLIPALDEPDLTRLFIASPKRRRRSTVTNAANSTISPPACCGLWRSAGHTLAGPSRSACCSRGSSWRERSRTHRIHPRSRRPGSNLRRRRRSSWTTRKSFASTTGRHCASCSTSTQPMRSRGSASQRSTATSSKGSLQRSRQPQRSQPLCPTHYASYWHRSCGV
jgi:hypothetical protein